MKYLMGFLLLLFSLGAYATDPTIDVSAVTALISGAATTAVTSIGVAMLSLSAVVMGFKWAKMALFS